MTATIGWWTVHLRTECEIDCPPQRAWSVFADWPAWRQWNPYVTDLSGVMRAGETLSGVMRIGGADYDIHPVVRSVEPGRRFIWNGGKRFRAHATHSWTLIPVGDTGVRLIHEEHIRGVSAATKARGMLEPLHAAFLEMNAAFKARCET